MDENLVRARKLLADGFPDQAFPLIRSALNVNETKDARRLFTVCVRGLSSIPVDQQLKTSLARALEEAWTRPDSIATVAASIVAGMLKQSRNMAEAICDPLLLALLRSTCIPNAWLEDVLTNARRSLLANADHKRFDNPHFTFGCALACQCFLNEYIYQVSPEEDAAVADISEKVVSSFEASLPIKPEWLVAIGCYQRLVDLRHAEEISKMTWPDDLQLVVRRQITEPLQEREIAQTIPRLTPITNEISLSVQQQYEASPYPRWLTAAPVDPLPSFYDFIQQAVPWTKVSADRTNGVDLLIAGCGTGQHAIETARRARDARILAIDLSKASLAYAIRKTRELGLTNISYGQADLLSVASLQRSFDVIEAAGSLQALADPLAGWSALLECLKAKGFMLLGLYSENARRDFVKIKQDISTRGYSHSISDIRRAGKYILSAYGAVKATDFYSKSDFVDLLLHVQEVRSTIPGISSFLERNDLRFLGFVGNLRAIQNYVRTFPGEPVTDLSRWHDLETKYPDTFAEMYQFWVQKI